MAAAAPQTATASPFARAGQRYLDMGYSIMPVGPGTKVPGDFRDRRWRNREGWTTFCERLPTHFDMLVWNMWPDAGVCVALGPASGWLVAVDLDHGSPEVRAAIEVLLPPSPVRKKGAKGYTAFYRGSPAIPARVFRVNGQSVCEVLAKGRQTVLPPTIHPDTGQPYHWLTLETLEDTAVDELPVLPDDIVDRITAALTPFGYQNKPEPGPRKERPADADAESTVWAEVNAAALTNLDAWVPALHLEKCRRAGGRYEAVAHWRPSSSGRPMAERKRNLKIHQDGIRDFGDDRGYSPLDLVAASCGCSFDEAFAWLRDRVLPRCEVIVLRPKAEAAPVKEDEPEPAQAPEDLPPHDPETGEILGEEPPATDNPFLPEAASGILGMMAARLHETNRLPIPEFSMLGAIACASVLFGRRFVGPTEGGLNLYLIGLAGTAAGKNHVVKRSPELLRDAGLGRFIGPDDITSDTSILKVLRKRPCFLMPMDEFGMLFQNVSGPRAANWERRILKVLLELYTSSTSAWTGKEYAADDADRSLEPIQCPTISLLGISTLTEFYAGLTERNLSDGLLNRITVISPRERANRQRVQPSTHPEALLEAIRSAGSGPALGNLAAANALNPYAKPALTIVPWESDTIRDSWEAIEDWQWATGEAEPILQGVVGRAAEQTLKLATLRALSRDWEAPAVGSDDIAWGWAIVAHSIETIQDGIKRHMAGSDFERLHKTILEAIREAGPAGIAHSHLLRRKGVSKAKPKEFDEAIQYLVKAELIAPPRLATGPKGGRPGMRFFLPAVEDAADLA